MAPAFSAVRSGTDQIRWIEAYDDHTLVFFHKEALATNVWNINFPVIPKHIYEKSIKEDPTLQDSEYHVRYENKPVTGGPFVISKRSRNQEIVLERRESWYMHEGKQYVVHAVGGLGQQSTLIAYTLP